MGRNRWWAGMALVVAVVSTGCGSSTTRPSSAQAARHDALWADLPPDVEQVTARPVVPGPGIPAAAILTNVAIEQQSLGGDPAPPEQTGAQTLYADPSAPAFDGPALLVGRGPVSDDTGSFTTGGEAIEIEGRPGKIEQHRDIWVVSWSLDITVECACDQYAVVIGRELPRDEVIRAARTAKPLDLRPSVAASAIPAGLRSLGTLTGIGFDIPNDPSIEPAPNTTIDRNGDVVTFTALKGDPRLETHLRFWTDVRRRPGATIIGTVDDELVIINHQPRESTGRVDTTPVEDLLDHLTTVTRAQARSRMTKVLARPQDAADSCGLESSADPTHVTYIAIRLDDARVIVGLRDTAHGYDSCESIIEADGHTSDSGGGGPTIAPVEPDQIRLLGGANIGTGRATYRIVAGDAPATATRVITDCLHRITAAVISATGPNADRRWFATARPLTAADSTDAPCTTAAYDSTGHQIAHASR